MNTQTKFIIGTILVVAGFALHSPIAYLFCFAGGYILGDAFFNKNK